MAAGSAYIKGLDGNRSIENVSQIGVANSYVIFTFVDGSVVLEREDGIESVQFTPYETDSSEETSDGESNNNSSG